MGDYNIAALVTASTTSDEFFPASGVIERVGIPKS